VSEWLLINANSAIFQLYHGENKLIFNDMYTWLVTSPNLWVTPKGFLYKHIKQFLLRLYLQLFVEGLKSYLRYLCLFVYSGVVYLFFLSSSCVPYVVGFSGLSTLIAPLVLFSNGLFPIYFILVYIYIYKYIYTYCKWKLEFLIQW
jgi:hypothetical protein